MKRPAAFAVTAVAALVIGLAPPASAGVISLEVDPTSGPVGTTVELTLFCGFGVGQYDIFFVDSPETGFTEVVNVTDAGGGAGPFVHEIEIPAQFDQGPLAPFDVEPGDYDFVAECDNEDDTSAAFTVTGAPDTTTTTADTTTTTQAEVAPAVVQQPSFTG